MCAHSEANRTRRLPTDPIVPPVHSLEASLSKMTSPLSSSRSNRAAHLSEFEDPQLSSEESVKTRRNPKTPRQTYHLGHRRPSRRESATSSTSTAENLSQPRHTHFLKLGSELNLRLLPLDHPTYPTGHANPLLVTPMPWRFAIIRSL
jgi:hypothetical protein